MCSSDAFYSPLPRRLLICYSVWEPRPPHHHQRCKQRIHSLPCWRECYCRRLPLVSFDLPSGPSVQDLTGQSIRTSTTDSPSYLTSGFYKIEKGKAYPLDYTCEETKYVISGQIDVLDEATGVTHHLVPGDFAFFYVGSKVQFSTKSAGLAFYAVTRPVKAAHPNLAGREEDVKSKSKL
jgi:uncharacterized cupin superfamily protein